MNQVFHGDEVAFLECAKGVLSKGRPVFDHSLLRPNQQCLWHPPTYIYFIVISILFFGENIYSIRLVSAVFNVLTILLVYLTAKNIFTKNKNKERIALFASFLYALNPLTIQSSILIDIDGGILNFFTVLFIYFFIKKKSAHWLVLSLFLVFWSKESGPVILFASFLIFYAFERNWRGLFKIFAIFIVSWILFLASFWIYSHALDLNFFMSFGHNLNVEGVLSRNLYLSVIRGAWAFKGFFYFAIPFFIILFAITSLKFYYEIWGGNKINKNLLFLSIFSIVAVGLFTYLGASGWGFPKYYIVALPPISIFIAGVLLKYYDIRIRNNDVIRFLLLFIVMIFYFILFLKDPLIPEFDSTAKNADLGMAVILILKSFSLYVILPFIIALFFTRKNIILCLIFLIIIFYFYINILHASVNYSTYYNYGDNGLNDVIKFFKDNNIAPNQIVAYPNVGYYIGMSNYYEIMFTYTDPNLFKEKVIENNDIEYMVIYERDIGRIGEDNMNYFRLERKFGTYYIFKKIRYHNI